MKALLQTGLRWLWIALLVIGVDQLTKMQVQYFLLPYDVVPVFPGFDLTLAYNRGAAFSFLNYASGWQVPFFGVLAVLISGILLVWLKRLKATERWMSIAIVLVIGGALGNLWDRIAYGHVIDFIDLYVSHYHWPVFNLADAAICVGAFMLVIEALFMRSKDQ